MDWPECFERRKHICRKFKRLHQALYVFILLMVGMSGSCSRAKPSEPYTYRLSEGGYSPITNNLLFVVGADLGEHLGRVVLLAMYNMDKGEVKHLRTPISPTPFDLAWSPKQDVFVVTHGDRMSLFQKDAAAPDGYTGTPIGCPLGFSYWHCAWNAKGDWLAVNCTDMREPSFRLGLYRLTTKEFTISDIPIDHLPPFWKNDTILYVPNKNSILEVSIDSGAPEVVRTIPIEKDASWVYGIFGGEVLIQKNNKIKLGNRILIELKQDTLTPVIETEELIFVVASSNSLAVFDHQGNELNRIDPGREIRFGSVGKEPNTVYGLAGSTLLHVCVESRSLYIKEVCDLADF